MPVSAADIARDLDLSGMAPAVNQTFATFNAIHKSLIFFRKTHYDQYVPTFGPDHKTFEERLTDWLHNVSDRAAQARLFEVAPRIVFFAREDLIQLYRSALYGPVCRWMVDQLGLQLDDADLNEKLWDEIENHTWFTSITDSLLISQFHHANNLGGSDLRPDWKSLAALGDAAKIKIYMDTHCHGKELRRIVILEDFVGSGTQMNMNSGSVTFAARTFPSIPVLLCPLLVCPEGARISRQLSTQHSNLAFDPVIELSQNQLISPQSTFEIGSFEDDLRTFCSTVHPDVIGDDASWPRPYTPWGCFETGTMIVLYTNCPANSLPIIQHSSNTWSALFPRSARIR